MPDRRGNSIYRTNNNAGLFNKTSSTNKGINNGTGTLASVAITAMIFAMINCRLCCFATFENILPVIFSYYHGCHYLFSCMLFCIYCCRHNSITFPDERWFLHKEACSRRAQYLFFPIVLCIKKWKAIGKAGSFQRSASHAE